REGEKTFTLARDARIVVDGKPGTLAGVPAGAFVTLNLLVDQKTAWSLRAGGALVPTFGTVLVKAVDADKNTITIKEREDEKTFTLAKDANIVVDGKPGKLSGIPVGAFVTLNLFVDQKT